MTLNQETSGDNRQGRRGSQERQGAERMVQRAWLPGGSYSQTKARVQEKGGGRPSKKSQFFAQFLVLSQF